MIGRIDIGAFGAGDHIMTIRIHLSLALYLFATGCTTMDSAKRIAYETSQNIGQQQCQRKPDGDCAKRIDYDAYQRRLSTPPAK